MARMENPYFDAFLERASRYPDAMCLELHSAKEVLTFGEMERGIAAAARHYETLGVKEGEIVLIFAHHDPGTFWAFFGAQALGAIPSFMPPPTARQPIDVWLRDHRDLVARIGPAVLVCDKGIEDQVSRLGATRVLTTDAVAADISSAPSLAPKPFDPERIAFLQHSSGTTGLKKGVTVTYGQFLAQVQTYAATLDISGDDCVLSWLPIYHDMGLIAATLMPFALGIPITLVDTMRWLEEPSIYLELLASKPNSFSWLPNFAFPFLAQRGGLPAEADLGRVRAIINCSEPCKPDAMESFRKRFAANGLPEHAVEVCYGMAEYVFAVTQTPRDTRPRIFNADSALFEGEHRAVAAEEHGRPFVSVGRPLAGTDVRIGTGLPDGAVGEVCVRGPSLCSGYFAAPGITARKFIDGWYHSGDLGFLQDGELYITGREDDVIIVRGKNIYAHDVEMLATQTGLIKAGRVVALGIEDGTMGTQKLVVIAELSGADTGTKATRAIRAAIKETYGLSPADILLVAPDTLIKTTSGKISRSENHKRYSAGQLLPWGSAATGEPVNAS